VTDISDIAIEREDGATGGRYVMRYPDGAEGEMAYRRVQPGVISIYHTETPYQHRGHGHALQMVERGIADARAEGNKVIPSCSYVAAQFRRHPDWSDLRA
jgi:predicted GNAT family acetyltransferase